MYIFILSNNYSFSPPVPDPDLILRDLIFVLFSTDFLEVDL